MLADAIAWAWIGPPSWKYRASERAWGEAWLRPFTQALAAHRISLNGVSVLQVVVDAFEGYHWLPDPIWQAFDVIYPPYEMLKRGGGDCDEWAWCHALAVDHALKSEGWQAKIVTTYVKPFTKSHHFCVAVSPSGEHWAIQPRPTPQQPPDLNPLIQRAFGSCAEAARVITAAYDARLVWYDVRDTGWRLLEGPVRV